MPRYSYICTNCENQVEAFHSSDERLSICEKCNQESLKKVLYQVNTIKPISTESRTKVGSVVNEKIQEMKEELKEYRKQLKKETM